MLKKITYIGVILYLIVLYGQNLLAFGSDLRINLYFIGMSIVNSLIAYALFKAIRNMATSFYFFLTIGHLFNEVFFQGIYSYIELMSGVIGIIYILIKKK